MAIKAAQAYEVIAGHVADDAVGGHIAPLLKQQGFCVLTPGYVAEDTLADARQQAAGLSFYEVNEAVADGLLGPEGSASVADLDSASQDAALVAIDNALDRLWAALCPYMDYLEIETTMRSDAVVHRTGAAPEETPELTESQVTQWQFQFLRHSVMLVAVLGPKHTTLELRPFDIEDAEVAQVPISPGSIIIVRPDLMTHRLSGSTGAFAVSCFLMAGRCRRGLPININSKPLVPAAQALEDWTVSRLKELKDKEEWEDCGWETDIPRSWQAAMNHVFHRGQITGIGSDACVLPTTRSPETFYLAATGGVDYAMEVPNVRWDHDAVYDPAPDGYTRMKTFCRHGCFAEGIELFDNKMFNLSIFEAKGLDPHSRMLLEVGYEALANMGYTKKHLMNTAGGVYVGCENNEWAYQGGMQVVGGVSGMLCFHSGRISFCLGMKGPSLSITAEAASGLTALMMASESVQKKGTAVGTDYAIGIAANLLLSPVWWPNATMNGTMSKVGRCLAFDASADGNIRGDATVCLGVKNASEVVDGEVVKTSADNFLGTVAGGKMSNAGQSASITAPNAPAMQQVVADAVRNASISHADVDGVEAHCDGHFLGDAVEVRALWRAHRAEFPKERLQLGAVKSTIGNQVECGGLTGLMKIVRAASWGHQVPNLHLGQLNPHIYPVYDGNGLDLVNEALEFPFRSTFNGVMSRGMGGMHVYVVAWGTLASEQNPVPERAILPMQRNPVPIFWPGGGGELEDDKRPRKRDGYYIVGTFSRWRGARKMVPHGDGVYMYDIILGENCWEKFQIWLDGDEARALHPGELNAPSGSAVMGPTGASQEWDDGGPLPAASSGDVGAPAWLIDGRPWDGNDQAGRPGDIYTVRFEVAGRWRLVTWSRASSAPAVAQEAAAEGQVASDASYYVAGSWNGWKLEEMSLDTSEPGRFSLDLKLPPYGESGLPLQQSWDFFIVRDGDWSQVLRPEAATADGSGTGAICGPDPDDDEAGASPFILKGRADEPFRIELRRVREGDVDIRRVTWQKVPQGGE